MFISLLFSLMFLKSPKNHSFTLLFHFISESPFEQIFAINRAPMHNLKKSMFSTVQLVGKFAVNFWCCKSLINVLSWCQTKCRKRLWIFFGFNAEIPYTSSQYSTIPTSHENFIHLRLTPYYYNNVRCKY